jgi:HSP20 family molecular chaperone IbpA
MKIPFRLEGENMSARWRRNKKNLKWLDFQNHTMANSKNPSKKLSVATTQKTSNTNFHPSKTFPKRKWKAPTPLIDIFQEQNAIIVIAEIVGFNKETLKIHVKDQKLTLSAKTKERRYYKTLNLPKIVIPNTVYTNYKNGVLEIKLKKAQTIGKEADQNAT